VVKAGNTVEATGTTRTIAFNEITGRTLFANVLVKALGTVGWTRAAGTKAI